MIIDISKNFPHYKNLNFLFSIYHQAGSDIQLVGGCVRDAILRIACKDIDLATPLLPEIGLELFKTKAIPIKTYGLSHGTITPILHGTPYEITTLRTDQQTFGRHAQVHFNASWEQDAQRRDFTINALYIDHSGTVHDYVGGISDTLKGKIQFVGQPEKRICEDFLRILRLFRFYAFYGKQPLEARTLDACFAYKDGLRQLSGHRIKREIYHLLTHPHPYDTLKLMNQCNLLEFLNFGFYDHSKISYLQELELSTSYAIPCFCRFLCLFPNISNHLHFFPYTKIEKKTIDLSKSLSLVNFQNTATLKRLCYTHGTSLMSELCIIIFAHHQQSPSLCLKALKYISSLSFPLFPVTGKDLLTFENHSHGQEIGLSLKSCFEWWISQSPFPSKEECLIWIKNRSLRRSNKKIT